MIVDNTLINKLKGMGLNSYEVKIWTALLSRGVSTAGELSDIANVPRSRSYDVLESLEKKGFVVMKVGKPIKYIAVPPKEVLERVKKNIKKEADRDLNRLDDLKDSDVLTELEVIHQKGYDSLDPVEFSGSLKTRENTLSHMNTVIKGASKEVIIVSTAQFLETKIDFLFKSLVSAKDRGVKIKVAAPVDSDNKAVQKLKGIAEVKSMDIKARFVVADSENLIFMLTKGGSDNDPALWVNTGLFAKAIVDLFYINWKSADILIN